jgi:hypothetical protein
MVTTVKTMAAPPLEEKSATKLTNNQSINPNVVAVAHNIVLGLWKDPWTRLYWAQT